MQPADAGQASLQGTQIQAQGAHAVQIPTFTTKGQQVGHALDAVHEMSIQLAAHLDEARPRAAQQGVYQQGQAQAGQDQEQEQGQGQPGVKAGQQDTGQGHYQEGYQRRRQGAQVKLFQRLDVGDDARKKVTAAVGKQAGRGQGLQPGVEPDPQAGQEAKGEVV